MLRICTADALLSDEHNCTFNFCGNNFNPMSSLACLSTSDVLGLSPFGLALCLLRKLHLHYVLKIYLSTENLFTYLPIYWGSTHHPTCSPPYLLAYLHVQLSSQLPTRSPTHQPTCSPPYSPPYLLAYLHVQLPTQLPTRSPTHQPTCSPPYSPPYLLAYLHVQLPTQLPTRSPTHQPTRSKTCFKTCFMRRVRICVIRFMTYSIVCFIHAS
jgi:hypothetical protein